MLGLTLLAGCPKSGLGPVDPSLPEADTFQGSADPWSVFDEAASGLQPGQRARALDAAIRSAATPLALEWGARALYDPSPWVQRISVDALATHRPSVEVDALLSSFVERPSASPYVRAHVAVLLGDSCTESAREALRLGWRSERDPWARSALALGALAQGDEEALATVVATLSAGNIALEPQFLMDVAHVGGPELVEALREAQDNVEPELALSLAAARLAAGDSKATRVLRDGLGDSDPQARLEALELLVLVPGDEATDLLNSSQDAGDLESQTLAALALAARTNGSTKSLLKALASDDVPVAVLGLQWASRVVGAEPARRVLKGIEPHVLAGAVSEAPEVRAAALVAARELGIQGIDAVAMLADDYPLVRIEAARLVVLQQAAGS